jgi:hypothetical protein
VQVNRSFADAGMFSDVIDSDAAITPALEELRGGVKDALSAE